VVLICHAESILNRRGVARWLSSFADLVGIVVIEETSRHWRTRLGREWKRVGGFRLIDVAAFRLYYGLVSARADGEWLKAEVEALEARYPTPATPPEVLRTADPNSDAVHAFLGRLKPDFAVARCKRLLAERIFSAPRHGTFVLHPGVCPEYRNAHGAFWALARGDLANVGLTLLRVDRGVDTGPVYGYFSYRFDERRDSHIVIMSKLLLENLDAIRDRVLAVMDGTATPLDTRNRASAVWGQPWLSSYLRWKRQAKRRRDASTNTRVS
jgi:hypothetical protein